MRHYRIRVISRKGSTSVVLRVFRTEGDFENHIVALRKELPDAAVEFLLVGVGEPTFHGRRSFWTADQLRSYERGYMGASSYPDLATMALDDFSSAGRADAERDDMLAAESRIEEPEY